MRVAVLGGGMGGLSAAWELARQGHQVTVYQTGWRLGGKGASGREAQFQQRIHEHGLHVLMGFYDQAFTLLRDVYAEAHKAPTFPNGKPLPWANAVEGWDTCVFSRQRSGGAWSFFDVDFPPAAGNPWDGVRPSPDFTDLFKAGVQVLLAIYAQLKGLIANPWLDAAVEAAIKALLAIAGALTAAMRLTLAAGLQKALGLVIATVINAGSLKSERDEWLFIAFCFAAANALGMLRDDLVKPSPDFASIDHYDYRDWLGSALDPTGCPDWASRQSPFVTALYDLAFSRERTLAAGVTLKVLLRLGLHYRGHLSFRMAAGMGDIVFAPFYIALKQQLGVQFRFFHRVKALRLDAGKTRIDSVEIERQVGQWNGYDPLVDVNGLACWPHEPKTALLDAAYQGDYAAAGNVMPYDFERDPAPSKYRPENTFTITRGTDFDVVVLAIPVGAHAPVCGDLIAAHPGFATMVGSLRTIRTAALQVWIGLDFSSIKSPAKKGMVISYEWPFNSWADMTLVLKREAWGSPKPLNLAYFCDAVPDAVADGAAGAWAAAAAQQFLTVGVASLWPAYKHAADTIAELTRVNLTGSDRYVLTEAGMAAKRLAAGQSGFVNLALAGDWVATDLNSGCLEAATMGGLSAAAAIINGTVTP